MPVILADCSRSYSSCDGCQSGIRRFEIKTYQGDEVAILIATAIGAVLGDVDLLIARQEGPGAVVHAISDEVLVNVCVENAALVIVGLLLLSLSLVAVDAPRPNPGLCRGDTSARVGH